MQSSISKQCPSCAHAAEYILVARDTNNRVDEQQFPYFRCKSCHLVFIGAIPSDLGKYYSKDYAPYQRPQNRQDLIQQLSSVQFRIDLVKRYKSRGSLLEIGPSYGAFALLAQEHGFEVEVVEMDAGCCAFIKNELGIKTNHSSNVDATVRGLEKSFDVIALWHNIEHLTEPWTTLKLLSARLKPGGILILSTPNPEALQFALLQKRWVHLDAPRHLYLLPPTFTERTLREQGVSQVYLTGDDADSRELTVFGWAASFKALARGRPLPFFLGRVFGRILSRLFAPFEKGLRGSAYTGIYQKKAG